MRVRVLIEQRFNGSYPERQPLASGKEYDIDKGWALELLSVGAAEPVVVKPEQLAERRPKPEPTKSERREPKVDSTAAQAKVAGERLDAESKTQADANPSNVGSSARKPKAVK